MGTCVSKCYPCSTAGADDRSLPGSPTTPPNHALAVHPLPLPAAYSSSPTSTSTSLLSVSATSSLSMASSTILSSSSSSRLPRPFSTDYLKALPCRDMEVVVLDPNPNKKRNKKKLSASATTPRPLPRKPLSVVRSPRKQPSSHIPTTAKRMRLLPGAPPPAAGAAAPRKRLASCRLATSTATSKSRVPPFPRGNSARATDAGVAGAAAEDDLNNPVISMDCFIFL